MSWDTIITAAVTASLVLVGWIYTSGRASGQTAQEIKQLKQENAEIKQLFSEQLTMLSDGQVEVMRRLEVLQAEQRILHQGQLSRLPR